MRFGPRLYTVVRLQQGPVRGPEFVVGELARLVCILANRKGGHLQSARKLRSGNVRIQEPTRFSKDSEVAGEQRQDRDGAGPLLEQVLQQMK